jgi:hypothetical protein
MIKLDVLRLSVWRRRRRPEQRVPKSCLLHIVAAISTSFAIMQVVIFNHQLATKKPQHERYKSRHDGIHT